MPQPLWRRAASLVRAYYPYAILIIAACSIVWLSIGEWLVAAIDLLVHEIQAASSEAANPFINGPLSFISDVERVK